MGRFYPEIPDDAKLIEWIRDQKLFHVATAPLNGGHVNVSPKGLDTFKLVSHKACWYLDLTGSGNETISHLYEPGNGRMTILFQAFQGPPRILRLFGKGRVIEHGTPEFDRLLSPDSEDDSLGFPTPRILPGARAIIWLDITRVGTSCGWSVPFMKFESHRNTLTDWAHKREVIDTTDSSDSPLPPKKGLQYYWLSTNTWSIDGLPGMRRAASLATSDIIRTTMAEAGLPTTSSIKGSGTARWILVWLLGVIMGMLLLALMERRVGPPLKSLNLPVSNSRLLDFSH